MLQESVLLALPLLVALLVVGGAAGNDGTATLD